MPPGDPTARPRLRLVRRIGVLVGLALLIAAALAVWRQWPVVGEALASIREPSWPHVAVLALAVVANLVLTGLLFSVLISRYGRVGLLEMQAVMAAATLINFLPLRPGLFGRLAWHHRMNAIRAVDAVRTIVQALLCSVAVAGVLVIVILICRALDAPIWIGVPAPLALAALATAVRGVAWRWAVAFGIRYLEVLIWAVRYHAAFALLGIDLDASSALALACISILATLVPFFSNGLGLREWAIGLTAPYLAGAVTTLELGLAAELVNRGVEILVVAAAGLIAMGWLARHAGGKVRAE